MQITETPYQDGSHIYVDHEMTIIEDQLNKA